MKTKWHIFGVVAFLLGVTFTLSAAFQSGRKEPVIKYQDKAVPAVKSKDLTAPVKVDSVAQVVLPDSVLDKFKKVEELKFEVKSATAITASKTKDDKAEADALLEKVIKLEKLVQQAPFVEPLPGKMSAATQQTIIPDSGFNQPKARKRSFFKRIFRLK